MVVIIASAAIGIGYNLLTQKKELTPTRLNLLASNNIIAVGSQTSVVELTDDLGHTVKLTAYPQKIASLAPGCTEMLFAVGAGDKVKGVTSYCDYPYNFSAWVEAGNMSLVGGFSTANEEAIMTIGPDLIVASGDLDNSTLTSLENKGYTSLAYASDNLNAILNNLLIIGKVTNNAATAQNLVVDLQARINNVANTLSNAHTSSVKVYFELWNDPLMSIGPGTFIDNLITLAGGQNIFSDSKLSWPEVSSDSIISKQPDVIICVSMSSNVAADVGSRAGWNTIPAVANGRIYTITDDNMFMRPGPRLVDALEMMAHYLHPDIFPLPN